MSTRSGFVLVVSLVVLLALALLTTGLVTIGSRELLLAGEAERIGRGLVRAESAIRHTLARWSTREAAATVGLGETGVLVSPDPPPAGDGEPTDVLPDLTLERLEPDLFLLRAEVAARTGVTRSAPGRAAALVRVLDPADVENAFPAAITAGSVVVEAGLVSGLRTCSSSPVPVSYPAIRSARAADVGASAVVSGDPPLLLAPVPPMPAALVDPYLAELTDIRVGAGEVAPRPSVAAGSCSTATSNWGGLTPGSPCYTLRPLVVASGPLVAGRGEGRGILVVDGDLRLEGSFTFEGLLVVSGRLTLDEEARIRGAIRAEEVLVRGGRVDYDGCVVRAAASAPTLDRAFRPAAGLWVPTH